MSHIFTEAKLEQAIIELLGQHTNNAGQNLLSALSWHYYPAQRQQ